MRAVWSVLLVAVVGLTAAACRQPKILGPESAGAGSADGFVRTASLEAQLTGGTPTAARVSPGTLRRFYDRDGRPSADFAWRPAVPDRAWDYVVLHHTGTETGSVTAIDAAHRRRTDARGHHWQGIGYHFVIGNGNGMPDGKVEPTFRWTRQLEGAHAGEGDYNRRGIGVVLVGDFERRPPTPAQLSSARRLVAALRGEYGIGDDGVIGHGTIKATACPGRLFPMDEVAGR